MEGGLAKRTGLEFVGIPSGPLGKAISFKNISSLTKLVLGVGRAYRLLQRFEADVVISTGGYTSAGVVLAQRLRGGRIIIHEQNVIPGRTNLKLSRIADKVCLTFEETASYFDAGKTVYTGMPMSASAVKGISRDEARRELDLDPEAFTVFVTGGSQGARKLNEMVTGALPRIQGVQVLHQVGEKNFKEYEPGELQSVKLYRPVPYIHDIYKAYAAADLVICRAGAATIGDLTTSGRPAILVPYPFAYADHQTKNAECVSKRGAGITIEERELTVDVLAGLILELKEDHEKLSQMASASAALARPEAAKDIVKLAVELAE
jgi:UDP-N-acetylglucosamine--N-acetylmuramyl-(pentapeptide) pyrophosphoryl-undecaprenol N-acetylglucosamine transferase